MTPSQLLNTECPPGGAVEPVAWGWQQTLPGRSARVIWRTTTNADEADALRENGIELVALVPQIAPTITPPVEGWREAAARIIDPQAWIDREVFVRRNTPGDSRRAAKLVEGSIAKADAIAALALPAPAVQPERIKALENIEALSRELVNTGMKNRGVDVGLVVVENRDRSDPHYRLCTALDDFAKAKFPTVQPDTFDLIEAKATGSDGSTRRVYIDRVAGCLYEIDPAPAVQPEGCGWRRPDEIPNAPAASYAYRIVAVKRAGSGKVATFAALYLNAMPLWFEDENDSKPVTGWNGEEEGDEGPHYRPVLSEGDELLGWREFPTWPAASPDVQPEGENAELLVALERLVDRHGTYIAVLPGATGVSDLEFAVAAIALAKASPDVQRQDEEPS